MTTNRWKRHATGALRTAVKLLQEGSASALQAAAFETNRALEIAFDGCVLDKPQTREKDYFFQLSERFAAQFELPADDLVRLKRIYRPMRNRTKIGETPLRNDLEAFISLAIRWLEAADADVLEIAGLWRQETSNQVPPLSDGGWRTRSLGSDRGSDDSLNVDALELEHPLPASRPEPPRPLLPSTYDQLPPASRGRIKVIDLAHELGLTTRDLLIFLEGLGHRGMRSLSPVPSTLAHEARLKLSRGRELPPEPKPKRRPPVKTLAPEPPVAKPKRPRLVRMLARELEITPDEILVKLKEMGFVGMTDSSPLTPGTERKLKALFHKQPDQP